MLTRNIRIEEDLVDQLLNSTEKRLARTLLLLAHYGQPTTHRELPDVSQEILAEMVGTTRSRVNFFMNKFRKLGFIEYKGGAASGVKVRNSLRARCCATDCRSAAGRLRRASPGDVRFASVRVAVDMTIRRIAAAMAGRHDEDADGPHDGPHAGRPRRGDVADDERARLARRSEVV